MASEALAEMAAKAAALADERESLMAQLRSSSTQRPPRAKKPPSEGAMEALAASERVRDLVNKENEMPAKNVRFSSHLLTPKSNAVAKLTSGDADAAATRRARGMVSAIEEHISTGVAPASILDDTDGASTAWGNTGAQASFRAASDMRDEVALENATLKAMLNTKELELTSMRNKLRVADERATVLLSDLGVAKSVMGHNEGRDLADCKAVIKEITYELAQAHAQQQHLEADRDKSEASLLKQLQNSNKDLVLVQKELVLIEAQNRSLTKTLESNKEGQKTAFAKQTKEYKLEVEKLTDKLAAAEHANALLKEEVEALCGKQQKMNDVKRVLESKLQTVCV